jgi:hypothetical protein
MESGGLHFPTEHGLISIWITSIVLSISLALTEEIQWIGLLFSLPFSFAIAYSYDSIRTMVKSKFSTIYPLPILAVSLSSTLLIIWNFSTLILGYWIILGLIVLIWGIIAMKSIKQDYFELLFGTLSVTMQFSLIHNSLVQIENVEHFLYILAIWWIYSGIALVLVSNVGAYRKKLDHKVPFYIWMFFLISFIPMYILNFLELASLLVLIEPTFRSVKQYISAKSMRELHKNIKQIGWELVLSLTIFIGIILILAIFDIPITNKDFT